MPAPFSVMGIVNVTPDSFSDGGEWFDTAAAVRHGVELAAAGATILDVGGESTRPGAPAVPEDEELRRVVPVVAGLAAAVPEAVLSVDTTKAAVALAALGAGATYVNDVSALRADPGMLGVVVTGGARCCLMHMQGDPRTMQARARYEDVVDDVRAFLEERIAVAVAAGVPLERIDVDPGIGFAKTQDHNLELLRRLDEIVAIGPRVVIGTSRKSFLGRLTGRDDPRQRLAGTIATNVLALASGARVFRVHDVGAVHDALAVAAHVVDGGSGSAGASVARHG
ncbi:dihydropteroate synthase [Patulibacter sp.]|uniref:dihydropteroate synthase n=1 Tax=Patulibacter sp. TaxID=1912859 RepID=UPI00271E887F|nr:dihydropteroate synthase [Patulibacter sp.]MDO9408492.1 dihydropteroate synthase [Patulibacter sp.]